MIVTLTGNLLAEHTFEFPSWAPGRTQRATRETFRAGGKGINVSTMLTRLGARTIALCFAGGPEGDECLRWLNLRGIDHHAFQSSTPTRAGLVVSALASGQPETIFLGPDVAPDAVSLVACAAWLDAEPASHTLAFCGSFPGWDTPAAAPVREAIARRMARASNVYVDTYGPPLAWFVEKPVALVKINRAEFDQLVRETSETRETNANASTHDPAFASALASDLAPENPMPARLAAACRRWPAVRAWVVTDGPRPIWHVAAAANLPPASSVPPIPPIPPVSLQPPAIREISPTGAGDILFACILHGLIDRHFSLAEAIAEAIPFATAKVADSSLPEQTPANKVITNKSPQSSS